MMQAIFLETKETAIPGRFAITFGIRGYYLHSVIIQTDDLFIIIDGPDYPFRNQGNLVMNSFPALRPSSVLSQDIKSERPRERKIGLLKRSAQKERGFRVFS